MAGVGNDLRENWRLVWEDYARDHLRALGWFLLAGPWAVEALDAATGLVPGSPLRCGEVHGLLGLSVAGLVIVSVTRKPRSEEREHEVTLNYVATAKVTPYYVAICECGWVGETHPTVEDALNEALTHSPRVESRVDRLLTKPP